MKVGKQGVETRARSQVVKKGGGEVKRNRGGISRAVDKEETGQKERKKKERAREREKREQKNGGARPSGSVFRPRTNFGLLKTNLLTFRLPCISTTTTSRPSLPPPTSARTCTVTTLHRGQTAVCKNYKLWGMDEIQ